MNKVARARMVAGAACAALACHDGGSSRKTADTTQATDLAGLWEIRLKLERPVVLVTTTTRMPDEVRGYFAFVRNHARRDRYPAIGTPSYYGSYDVDFAPFGFGPSTKNVPPSALASLYAGDSVLIALDATDTELAVTLRGAMTGDSLVGGWTASSRRVGGGGVYVMRRVR